MPYGIIRPIIWVLMRIAYTLLGGIRFEGREHVPLTGGVLITPNHISDSDPPTVCLALPRGCYVMAKEELFKVRVLGPLIRWLHAFPVKRYTADRAALRRAEELLEQGEAVVIFPEGKLSLDGKLQPMLPGALLVAQRTGVPIIPTIILGTDSILPYGDYIPRHAHRVTIVRFGLPVSIAELTGGIKGGEGLKLGAVRLREILLALQDNRPYPDMPPAVKAAKAAREPDASLAAPEPAEVP